MLLPVGLLAVPAAVLDEAAAGAARQGGLVALAVGAGAGFVAGGRLLLLGWHGFGRRGEKRARGLGNPSNPRSLSIFFLVEDEKFSRETLHDRQNPNSMAAV